MIPLYYMEEKILKTTTAQQQNGSKFETWENRQQHWRSTKRMNEFLFPLFHGKSDENEERKRINWYDIYIHWRRRRKKTQRNRWLRRMPNENEIQSTSWPRQKKIDKWFDCLVCLCVCEWEKNVSVFLFFIYDDYDGAEKNGFVEFSVRFHQEKKNMKAMCFWETKSFV